MNKKLTKSFLEAPIGRPRVAFVCERNPRDRRTWSGTPFGVFSSLEKQGCDVEWVAPRGGLFRLFWLFIRSVDWLITKIIGRSVVILRWPFVVNILSNRFKIDDCRFDFVLSIGLTPCAFYRTKLPVVAVIDATFHGFNGYYGKKAPLIFSRFADESERKSAQRADRIIVASDWAKKSLTDYYGVSESKILVWQLGANICAAGLSMTKIFPKTTEKLRLLFVGFDTQRKGLSIAIGATKLLNSKYGRDAVLDVIGTDGNEISDHSPCIRFLGHLNKNNPEEMTQFENLVNDAHIFILPTKAECAGMVFSEAAAYGLPVFSYDTGGVGSYVEHNGNGVLLPLSAREDDFAAEIIRCWDGGSFPRFSERGKVLFQEKLNWACWPIRFSGLIEDICSLARSGEGL